MADRYARLDLVNSNLSFGDLSVGRQALAIPGPSVMPERVMAAMTHPMVDIYAGELVDVVDEVYSALPATVGAPPDAETFVAIGNGHAAWEMALSNTLARGARVLVLNCGIFAAIWGEMAAKNGLIVEQIDAVAGRAVDVAVVEDRLSADLNNEIAAILTVHADTSSSARNDIAALRAGIDRVGHPAMLMVDCIASAGCDTVDMTSWQADLIVASCQKGLMTPPGVSFNFAGPRALAAHRSNTETSYYWDWTKRLDRSAIYMKFCGTPPVAHLYGLREALRMITEETMPARVRRHDQLAAAVHAAVDAWGAAAGFELYVTEPSERANSVTTVTTGDVDADRLRADALALGVVLGIGLHGVGSRTFRIGHMGYVNPPMLLGVIAAIDTALAMQGKSTDGCGVAAATAALGAAITSIPGADRTA